MSASKSLSLAAAVVLASAAAVYFTMRSPGPRTVSPVSVDQPSAPEPALGAPGIAPPVRHPIEAALPAELPVQPEALPALDESDAAVGASLASLLGQGSWTDLLPLKDVIRRIVVTVDNLPRERFARRLSPVTSAAGPLAVTASGDEFVISDGNRQRYAAYVTLAESVDVRYLAALYVRFYPLFQQAYEELGYPNGYFNDRLVDVLDHLLATPEPAGPLHLVQPKVLYEFADPELERLSAGQKVLLRMGPENAARVKARLREFRRRVAGGVGEG